MECNARPLDSVIGVRASCGLKREYNFSFRYVGQADILISQLSFKNFSGEESLVERV